MKNSVLIIGIDGVSWDLLRPWIEDGKLPTLSRLVQKGASGNLKTVIPPLSCTAWTSLFTGTNPGKHGIYEYTTKSGKLINSKLIKSEKIWNILSKHNKRCCVVNIPLTYPVDELNGYMISSFLTPPNEKIYSYPKEIMPLLEKLGYRISIKHEKFAFLSNTKETVEQKESILKDLYDVLEKRYLTLKELMNENWDFFYFVFNETSTLQYLFFDRKDSMLEFFKKIDDYLGDLIDVFSSKNKNPYIFIVSDHGYNPAPTIQFNLRKWLQEEGFLKDHRTLFQKTIPKIYKIVNKKPLSKLIFFLDKPKEVREAFLRKSVETSKIYYRNPGIYIEDKNMNKTEYDGLRNLMMEKLKQTKDIFTQDTIFQVVEKKEDIYSGNFVKHAPDIILVSKNKYVLNFSYDSEKTFENIKSNMPGNHTTSLKGIIIANGQDITYKRNDDSSILDIFPTLLHILNVPIPKNIDGKVIKNIFKENSDLYNKEAVLSRDSIEKNEKTKIKEAIQNINI